MICYLFDFQLFLLDMVNGETIYKDTEGEWVVQNQES
jgi:hypothetical protein